MAKLDLKLARLDGQEHSAIAASWNRCLHVHGLEQHTRRHETVIRRERVRDSIEHLGPLFSACRSQVQHIFQNIVGSGHAVILTDKSGTIIEFAVQSALEPLFRQAGLRRGADWSEAREGTNGIGTAIAEKRSLTIYREQHFYSDHAPLTCTGAPVFDIDGEVLALFDVSSIGRKDNPDILAHTRALLEMSARLVSKRNFQDHFADHWVMRFHPEAERVGLLEEGLIALDQNGHIVGLDQQAMSHLFVRDRGDLLGKKIDHLIDMDRDKLSDHLCDAGRVPASLAINAEHARDSHNMHARMIEPDLSRSDRVARSRVAIQRPLRPAKPAKAEDDHKFDAVLGRIGHDPALRALARKAVKLFEHDVPLLLTGETGVGKDSFARALHSASSRSEAPFIAVNCGALPENLLEGELFGYKAGAFTGAQANGFKGQILAANGGTLLLDEIGDMPLSAQTRLLQVLEQRRVTPLGSSEGIDLDIRLLAATHQPLEALCKEGKFREDLYYRICGFTLPLPSLRERTDLDHLVSSLLPAYQLENSEHFSSRARDVIASYHWPGNIRQLKHALKTASILADGGPISLEHLAMLNVASHAATCSSCEAQQLEPDGSLTQQENGTLAASLDISEREKKLIQSALMHNRWNVSRSAEQLGVSRNTLYRKMNAYGLRRSN
nr:sigma-54-dependent Fis family transcriptional regulator [uncultured Cohaesibacter sp.]